jgi:hypothetical protein
MTTESYGLKVRPRVLIRISGASDCPIREVGASTVPSVRSKLCMIMHGGGEEAGYTRVFHFGRMSAKNVRSFGPVRTRSFALVTVPKSMRGG